MEQESKQPLKLSPSRRAELEPFFCEPISYQVQLKEFISQVAEFRDRVAKLKAVYEEWYVQNQGNTETNE